MEKRFYRLSQFLGCYFHQDCIIIDGSVEGTLDAAIRDHPLELRRQVQHELVAVMTEYADDVDLRTVLNGGLGVDLHFRKPKDARLFAEHVERKLIASIKQDVEHRHDQLSG